MKFSLKTVLMLADQMLTIIEFVHKNDIVHGDLKPTNFLVGLGENSNKLYLIDFGVSSRFRRKGIHIEHQFIGGSIGTAMFRSINSDSCYTISRKDDLESIAYILLYFLKDWLPWAFNFGNTKEEQDLALKKKKKECKENLFKECPNEFARYFKVVNNLLFKEEPDYKYL